MSKLINELAVKKQLIKEAGIQRPKKKLKSVSRKTIEQANMAMHLWCGIHVKHMPKSAKKI